MLSLLWFVIHHPFLTSLGFVAILAACDKSRAERKSKELIR